MPGLFLFPKAALPPPRTPQKKAAASPLEKYALSPECPKISPFLFFLYFLGFMH